MTRKSDEILSDFCRSVAARSASRHTDWACKTERAVSKDVRAMALKLMEGVAEAEAEAALGPYATESIF